MFKINLNFFKKIFIIILLVINTSDLMAEKNNYFNEGKGFFEKEKYDESKFFFEKDIVFDPKSEKSYLYLAKIFKIKKNEKEQETNLNSVLIINPNNDEAIYMLTLLKITQSDYGKAKELIEKFDLVCKSFCSKKKELQIVFEKLIPENEQIKN